MLRVSVLILLPFLMVAVVAAFAAHLKDKASRGELQVLHLGGRP